MNKLQSKVIVLFLLFVSCSDLLVGPDPNNSPINNFNILWTEFDRYYPFFGNKNVNWNSLYDEFRVKLSDTSTDADLFEVVSDMTDKLKDGHVDIFTPLGNHKYYTHSNKYFSLDIIKINYLVDHQSVQNSNINYGNINSEIGYLHIKSFSTNYSRSSFEGIIDNIIEYFVTKSAIIIDVRNNGGGNSQNADKVAQRFSDKKYLHSYIQYRNGKNHDDFTDLIQIYIEPGSSNQYEGLVVILTNRNCFSTTEHFILEMKVLPNVTVIGDSSGGSMGSPIYRELPNGWTYRLPRARRLDLEEIIFEDIGILPDILQEQTEIDSINGVDKILERAIQYLLNN